MHPEVEHLRKLPDMFPRAFDDLDFRFARLARFPYLVLYRVQGKIVHILGVFHTATDPDKWRRRAETT
jgi:hypothetical protein